MESAVDQIVTFARDRTVLREPSWIGLRHPGWGSDVTQAQIDAFNEQNGAAYRETIQGLQNRAMGIARSNPFERLGIGLRERLAGMWGNHYVTE